MLSHSHRFISLPSRTKVCQECISNSHVIATGCCERVYFRYLVLRSLQYLVKEHRLRVPPSLCPRARSTPPWRCTHGRFPALLIACIAQRSPFPPDLCLAHHPRVHAHRRGPRCRPCACAFAAALPLAITSISLYPISPQGLR